MIPNLALGGHTTAGPVPENAVAGRADRAGAYLADEVFLYRVVGVSGIGETVELEDCYRLDVVRVALGDVRARRLRVVTPASVQS